MRIYKDTLTYTRDNERTTYFSDERRQRQCKRHSCVGGNGPAIWRTGPRPDHPQQNQRNRPTAPRRQGAHLRRRGLRRTRRGAAHPRCGGAADPGRLMPSASATEAMVFAVYIPPHAPSPGQMARSMRSRSSSLMVPALQAPTASKASMMVTFFSVPSERRTQPGAIDPA